METIQTHHLMKRTIDSNMSQDCARSVGSPKPNQVGTVLLYGIPIVSLYIESQERLCLAQISNTLLKQFSYNEIHNRRVALGITCVQCTPVQLEILRRAGAMPVSSRRCGMITRREAERLCKSFLGDNAPPRLPEDFAFSVHHECAWGCRGSFLPSRYNSSRAKCIKCSYCGLFFSPNKFIFHSHRIGPSDKYVQPDAANFNSWRRHMKLSGDPPEEIIYAWEDVKAMFNGGTRKRLMTSSSTSGSGHHSHSHSHHHHHHQQSQQNEPSPKRIKETSSQIAQPLIHAATAAAVASATVNQAVNSTSQFPVRPINIHHPASVTATNSAQRISNLNAADLQLPFSRTFMMDYMWHTQNKSNPFQFPNYALPWMKRPPGSLLFGAGQHTQHGLSESSNGDDTSSNSTPTGFGIHLPGCGSGHNLQSPTSATLNSIDSKTLPSFYNNSAFKPVINNQGRNAFPSVTAAAAAVATTAVTIAPTGTITPPIISDGLSQRTPSRNSNIGDDQSENLKECNSSDDEMVDIETTEEEQPEIGLKTAAAASQYFKFRTNSTGSESATAPLSLSSAASVSINIKLPPTSPVTNEIENSTEIVWDGFLKKEHQTSRNLTNLGNENGGRNDQIRHSNVSPTSSAGSSIDDAGSDHQSSSAVLLNASSSSSSSELCCNVINNNNNNSNYQLHHNHHHSTTKKAIFSGTASIKIHHNHNSPSIDDRSSSPLLLPPPPPSMVSVATAAASSTAATHPLSSSSSSSSSSPSSSSSSPLVAAGAATSSSPPSVSSSKTSAAVAAAAAAAAVAIAAFNNTHHHHHHPHHHHHHNQHSSNINNNNMDNNNCSPSQMLNISAVTTTNHQQRFSAAAAVAAAAVAVANSSNNNCTILPNNLNNTNNDNILHSSQNYLNTTNHHNHNNSNSNTRSPNNNNNISENCISNNNNSNSLNTISSNINNNNLNKTLNSSNNPLSNTNSNSNSNGSNNNNNNEFWSVARLSFEHPNDFHHHHHHHYRLPFYRHDITKHFQHFRHGETTTQTNGIG